MSAWSVLITRTQQWQGPRGDNRVLREEGGVPVLRRYLSHVCTRLYICVHMGKHMDMCAKTYTHTSNMQTPVCTNICVVIHLRTCTHVCTNLHTYTCKHTHTPTHTHTPMHTHIPTHTRMHTHTPAHMYAHTPTYMHTMHTHMPTNIYTYL